MDRLSRSSRKDERDAARLSSDFRVPGNLFQNILSPPPSTLEEGGGGKRQCELSDSDDDDDDDDGEEGRIVIVCVFLTI